MRNLIDRLEPRRLLAQAGTPDLTFGTNGRVNGVVVLPSAPAYDESKLRAAIDNPYNPPLVLPDGRVIAFLPKAYGYGASPESLQPAIVRFKADGQLDTTWGDRGFATIGVAVDSGSGGDAAQLRVDAQGRLLVVTLSGTFGTSTLARLTPAGRLDTAFSGDGKADVPYGATFIGVDSRSRPVLTAYSPDAQFSAYRFTVAGQPDASFDGDGVVGLGNSNTRVIGAIDSGDRVVLVVNGQSSFDVTRRLANGRLDSTFGTAGVARFTVAGPAYWGNATSQLLARSDGGYTFVSAGLTDEADHIALWQIGPRGADESFQLDVDTSVRLANQSVQIGMGIDNSISVYLAAYLSSRPAQLIRIAPSGELLLDKSLAMLPDVSGLARTTGPAGFRRDGSPVALSIVTDPPVPDSFARDPNGRVTGLVAWRVGGGIDSAVKQLPRMRVTDVLTVRSDGLPVFGFADVAGNFAGRADRQADGSFRARQGTLAGTYAATWSVAYGRVFANYRSIDFFDGDGVALNATVLEQNGLRKSFASVDGTGDYGAVPRVGFSLLPRGYATSRYSTEFGANVTNLYAPSGRQVQRALEYLTDVVYTLFPQRTTDNAFATPINNYNGEDGDDVNFPAGVMLRTPFGERVTTWGTNGAVRGGLTPWFADSRGRLLAFTADKKSIVRYTARGAIDSSFRAVFAQGWNLDIDSRDRIVAWRVLQNAGSATGDVQVKRFNADGSADATFGTNGLAVVDSGLVTTAAGQVYVDAADHVMVVSIERTAGRVKWSATRLRGVASAATLALQSTSPAPPRRDELLSAVAPLL